MTPEEIARFQVVCQRIARAAEVGSALDLDPDEVVLVGKALVELSEGAKAIIADSEELERELEEARRQP